MANRNNKLFTQQFLWAVILCVRYFSTSPRKMECEKEINICELIVETAEHEREREGKKGKNNSFVIQLGLYIASLLLSLTKIIHKSMFKFSLHQILMCFLSPIVARRVWTHSERHCQCGMLCTLWRAMDTNDDCEDTYGWYAARNCKQFPPSVNRRISI